MKYIDADKLKELIDEKWKELADKNVKVGGGKWDAEISTYLSVLRLINSLQQEQPEVDLEKEMQEEYYKYAIYESGSISGEGYQLEAQGHYECNLTRKEFKDIARHFYELGLNARKK